jgi:FKBP-type peptidyl-prolyl cis-trans isomerase 2
MAFQKKDFIEIEFTGRVKEGDIFDSNIKKDLEKLHAGHSHAIETKPLIFCLGEGMFLKAIDDFLIGKPETSASYNIELTSDKAFGKRMPQLVQPIPMKVFKNSNVNPVPGAMFNFDGKIAKILSVSGGRVMVDFNNPLAGKTVVYDINVLGKIDNLNEKIKSFIEFLFRKELKFSIENEKIVIEAEKEMVKFIEMFAGKFKEIFDLDLEVRETENKKENQASVA